MVKTILSILHTNRRKLHIDSSNNNNRVTNRAICRVRTAEIDKNSLLLAQTFVNGIFLSTWVIEVGENDDDKIKVLQSILQGVTRYPIF